MPRLKHKDTIILVGVTTGEYGNKKQPVSQHEIKATFLQNTGFLHSNNQDVIDSDAILYPDERNAVVVGLSNRLEGMYVIAPLFGQAASEAWYKITSVAVNRDHLLHNKIDNIQCLLSKAEALPGVS